MERQKKKDIYFTYGDFLCGNKLDMGKRFHDLSAPIVVDRIEYLRYKCAGKKVLHIGCLDHPEIIARRVKDGTWLHSVISDVSELCLGIDINLGAYELVQKEFNVRNIRLLDLASVHLTDEDLSCLTQIEWDLILCPEMLEHITSHQQFLKNLCRLSHGRKTRLVLTVPNAFQFANFINALRGFETINSDHRYWFTFYTLSRLVTDNGWHPRQLTYYNDTNGKHWLDVLSRLAIRLSRSFSNGFIMEATNTDQTASPRNDLV
jgi:hypothetical protein